MTSLSTNTVAGHTVGNQFENHRAVGHMPHAMPDTAAGPEADPGETVGTLGVGSQTDRREVHRGERHTEAALGLGPGEAQEGVHHTAGFGWGEAQEVRHIAGLGFGDVQGAHRTDLDLLQEDTRHRRHTG